MKNNLETITLQITPILKEAGVSRSFVFGSYARNEAHAESDLDLLVEFGSRKSLLEIIHIKHQLEDKMGISVDLLTDASIHPSLREYINQDKIRIL